jgi:hypothetical protein
MAAPANRVVALGTGAIGLLAAIIVPAAQMDTSSVVGVVIGVGAIAAIAITWLIGWQKYEARTGGPAIPVNVMHAIDLAGQDLDPIMRVLTAVLRSGASAQDIATALGSLGTPINVPPATAVQDPTIKT